MTRRPRHVRARGFVWFLSLASVACSTVQHTQRSEVEPWSVANLYPLAVDNAWSYEVDTGAEGSVLTTVRVTQRTGDDVVVQSGQETLRYRAEPGRLSRVDGGVVLKGPIAVGASWPSGATLEARVTKQVDQLVTPAGTFDGCIEVSESDRQTGKRVETTYCPGVGPARVVSELPLQHGQARVTALLRGFLVAPQ